MKIDTYHPLFAWECLDDGPEIAFLREALEVIPDARLLRLLHEARANGRDDYPVHVSWGVVLLAIMLRHLTIADCLAELRRNAELRRLIGIETVAGVPHKYNMSRFIQTLGQEPFLSEMRQIFDALVQRLGTAVPDLGRQTAGDATALKARAGAAVQGLPQPSGGRKEYVDDQGQVTKIVAWFGYKLHLVVDVKHEVALAWQVTDAAAGDGQTLPAVLKQAQANLPEKRIHTLAYDKAADDGAIHRLLAKDGIRPLIQIRNCWKQESEQMFPGATGCSNVVYDEAGSVFCYDKASDPPVRHQMAYIGHEAKRKTLKYRCPARHAGWKCPSDARCNGAKAYGMTVRVKQEIDLRRFPPIPRATKTFERLYKGRTAVERVNARLKIFWGLDDGNVVGAERFHAHVATVMIVHATLATMLARSPRREGTLGRMRIGPIQKALAAAPDA
jgi:hypothetical protein